MKQYITINELVPGLNGKDGLMRASWKGRKAKKQKYMLMIMAQTRNKFPGKVVITYIRYTCQLMDWDNHCASFKYVGDALVDAKVIKDDNPSIIIEFKVEQIKVPTRAEQRTQIIIEDAE